ncbi:N-acetylmuramoyl-L-alanine amidase [Neptunitalea chrysea]|uniref:N-acetylmuramoyl-L-alanine amidase n=2 Tax=Neptunitalea chrysea TaxID=1647581 RepID=A0A9W6B3H1_9FLAO|nr:N-acetylmuramoyl-L-alanine amidase [Neptunitalea chrysea]
MNHLYKITALVIALLVGISFSHATPPPDDGKFVVVLDAGHGGEDPGKVSHGYNEKDIALKIVLAIGKELEKDPKIKVVYTRKTDVFVELVERGRIANKANADLFISVHCNAHNSNASGTETYVLGLHGNKKNFEVAKSENEVIFLEDNYKTNYAGFDINSPEATINITIGQEENLSQSIELAKYIQNKFTNALKRKNRGVKQAAFVVLHQTIMPSVLIETGFITNTEERNFLKSTNGQSKISHAIVEAIYTYKTMLEENTGSVLLDISAPVATPITEINKEELPSANGISFMVKIASSTRNLPLKPENFNGLSPISQEKSGTMYKYFYGETRSYDRAKVLLTQAKTAGFKDAYVVAYKNGEKISVANALKSASN